MNTSIDKKSYEIYLSAERSKLVLVSKKKKELVDNLQDVGYPEGCDKLLNAYADLDKAFETILIEEAKYLASLK